MINFYTISLTLLLYVNLGQMILLVMVYCYVIPIIILFYVKIDLQMMEEYVFLLTHINCVQISPLREYSEFELLYIDII